MKQDNELSNQKNKGHKMTIHQGPKPKYGDIENNLNEFNRKLNNPITTWCIANEIFKYYQNLKKENDRHITNWIYRCFRQKPL